MKEKVYISGRITGRPREEYAKEFAHAAKLITKRGYKPVNPCEFPWSRWAWLSRRLSYGTILLLDIWQLLRCQRIYLIPGWKDSKGACIESFVAWNLGVQRLPLDVCTKVTKKMIGWLNWREQVKTQKEESHEHRGSQA